MTQQPQPPPSDGWTTSPHVLASEAGLGMSQDEAPAVPACVAMPELSTAFVARYGALFEHSPWVVQRAAVRLPLDDLHAGLMRIVYEAAPPEQLALIRAHPELAGKAAIEATLTKASMDEQASAGLDRLTPEEFARFHDLNARYRAQFGFPFIICVRRASKEQILAAITSRLTNGREAEIAIALEQIGEIVRIRLEDCQ